MTTDQLTYLVFGIVIVVALIFDLGLLSKKNTHITLRKALYQTIFWVTLALGFFGYMWVEEGKVVALEYLSAYLMEWSLSIDNIFVFILIFNFFGIRDKFYARVLLIGILMAIVFRIIFITVGIELVQRFEWLLYVFGGILVYTGISMFSAKHDEETNLEENRVYKMLKRILPITPLDGDGKWTMRIEGKKYYTSLFVVVIMLATTDIIFAVRLHPCSFRYFQESIGDLYLQYFCSARIKIIVLSAERRCEQILLPATGYRIRADLHRRQNAGHFLRYSCSHHYFTAGDRNERYHQYRLFHLGGQESHGKGRR